MERANLNLCTLIADDRNRRHERSLLGFTTVSGTQPLMLTWKYSEFFPLLQDFFVATIIVDTEQCSDVKLLFAYLNGADSNTRLQLILFAF